MAFFLTVDDLPTKAARNDIPVLVWLSVHGISENAGLANRQGGVRQRSVESKYLNSREPASAVGERLSGALPPCFDLPCFDEDSPAHQWDPFVGNSGKIEA